MTDDHNELLIATTTFLSTHRGRDTWINAGDVAENGSWPVAVYPDAFQPLEIRWLAPNSRRLKFLRSDSSSAAVSPASIRRHVGRGRLDTT